MLHDHGLRHYAVIGVRSHNVVGRTQPCRRQQEARRKRDQ